MIFFLDESGQDKHQAPYEVRAALAVPNERLWEFIEKLSLLEQCHFGLNLHTVNIELKGTRCLSHQRIRQSKQCALLDADLRRDLVRGFLQKNFIASKKKKPCKPVGAELAAYAQSCSAFIMDSLDAALRFGCKAFAAIVDKNAEPSSDDTFLRKDYRYMLDRFVTFVEQTSNTETGILVFDETEIKDSRRLLTQFQRYVNETVRGYRLTSRIVAAPFFVHSDLTPVIQVADFIAYIINWSVRFGKCKEPIREDMKPFSVKVRPLEWHGMTTDNMGNEWTTHGFAFVKSLCDKKRGDGAQPSPASSGQRDSAESPQPAQLLFPTIAPESKEITKRIKKSRWKDVFTG